MKGRGDSLGDSLSCQDKETLAAGNWKVSTSPQHAAAPQVARGSFHNTPVRPPRHPTSAAALNLLELPVLWEVRRAAQPSSRAGSWWAALSSQGCRPALSSLQ